LGDDLVIGNKAVAERYMAIIAALGVKYSPLKTHISTRMYEFAKRIILDGEEISPFPISAIKENSKASYAMSTLLMEEKRKG